MLGLAFPISAWADLVITEVCSNGSIADWFELTNTGSSVVSLSGLKTDDGSFSSLNSDPLMGIADIAPGESVVFVQGSLTTTGSLATSWGSGIGSSRIGYYSGASGGLGSNDGVIVYDGSGTELSRQSWTTHTSNVCRQFPSNNVTGALAVSGTNGAFTGSNSNVGSPGRTDGSTAPNAPDDSAGAAGITSTTATVQWAAPAGGGAPTGYIVEVSSDSFSTISQTAVVPSSSTSTPITGLGASTPYAYRVRGVNSGGTGPNSSVGRSFTTTAGNTAPNIAGLNENTAFSGVIGDSGDPIANTGLSFTVSDSQDAASALVVTAASGNPSVVANGNIDVVNSDGSVTLKITPVATGYADILVTVQDTGGLTATRTIHYAASANTAGTAGTRWYTGRSDGSTAIPLSDGTMLIGDDEAPAADGAGNAVAGGNALSAYSRTASGGPLAVLIPDSLGGGLGLGDPNMQTYSQCVSAGYAGVENNNCKADGEMDVEASFMIGSSVYVTSSHSNNKNGHSRPDRWRFFAADASGSGASASLALAGYYKWLREDLRTWDSGNAHGFGADYFGLVASSDGGSGQQPEKTTLDGFSIEGMTTSPDDSAAWFAFRAPLVAAPGQPAVTHNSAAGRVDALIVPVTNFVSLATASGGGTKGGATFGTPIRLDLGGRGIREIRKNAANQYLIVAGPPAGATGVAPHDFRLYSWDGSVGGNGLATHLYQRDADLGAITAPNTQCSTEGIVALPSNVNVGGNVDIVSDCGDADFYGDGSAAKDLAYNEWKKFRVDSIPFSSIVQTITFTPLGDRTLGSGTFVVSATGGASGNPVIFTSLTPAICQTSGANGTTVNLATAGVCTIEANQAGDGTYVDAIAVDQSFTVSLPAGTGGSVSSGTGQSASVSGNTWVFAPTGTGSLQTGGFIAGTGNPKSPPNLPNGYAFPYGLFDFVLLNGTLGTTATVAITYPEALPPSTVYWKYGPTSGNPDDHWYVLPEGSGPGTISFSADRRTIYLTLADSGLGDDDLSANGVVVDQGGPGVPASVSVPTLSAWGMIILSCLLALGTMIPSRRLRQ